MNDNVEQYPRFAFRIWALAAASWAPRRIFNFGLVLTAVCGANHVFADDASCKPVFDAITRLVQTPNHQFLTQSSEATGGKPNSTEMIFTGKTTYLKHDGRWQTSTVTPEQTLKRDAENRKNAKTDCRLLREVSVDGVSASLYSVHSATTFGTTDGQIWISKASALPLRQQIDLVVEGATGKNHVETRIVYTGVEAPPGAAPPDAKRPDTKPPDAKQD